MTKEDHSGKPLLSLILCSRNDEYMGNSRWRLETTLNYVAEQVEAVGRVDDVEVLVADWGSEIPLNEVMHLSPLAVRIVSFLHVPPEIARPLQKDSPFPEVLALNAAARRVRGEYIGRIDQDTLVGRHFLEVFFDLYDGKRELDVPLDKALLYSNRRAIPYWFAVRCPQHRHVSRFLRLFSHWTRVARLTGRDYWTYYVGIWLIHRDLWIECGGYDERFIYYNWMEVEMIMRLRQRYTLVDFGQIINCDFYHLEHLNPRARKKRRDLGLPANVFMTRSDDLPLSYHPNSEDWGLAKFELEVVPGRKVAFPAKTWSGTLVFGAIVSYTGMQITLDTMFLFFLRTNALWVGRAERMWGEMRGEHPLRWPRVLLTRWARWKQRA